MACSVPELSNAETRRAQFRFAGQSLQKSPLGIFQIVKTAYSLYVASLGCDLILHHRVRKVHGDLPDLAPASLLAVATLSAFAVSDRDQNSPGGKAEASTLGPHVTIRIG